MIKPFSLLATYLLFICLSASGQSLHKVVAPGAKPEKLAGGFSFTEGPAVDSQGNVYFTDQPTIKSCFGRWMGS